MQLEIKTQGVDFVVASAPQPKNDNDGRQTTDRDTGVPLHVTELVAMDDAGAEVIEVTTAGQPEGTKRQLVRCSIWSRPRGTSTAAAEWRSGPTRSALSLPPHCWRSLRVRGPGAAAGGA